MDLKKKYSLVVLQTLENFLPNFHQCTENFLSFRQSKRMVFLYDTGDLSQPLFEDTLDEAPSILIPYYDEDSRTVFLSGRVSQIS